MLTINIPTFNRPQSIKKLINTHRNLFKFYDIDINIFDNSSNEDTKNIFNEFKDQIKINYIKNNIHLHADENFYQSYMYEHNKEYVLLLGDTYKINDKFFPKLIDKINERKYEIIIFNHAFIGENIDKEISDRNELFEKLCSISTCMSTLVFHKSVLLNKDYKKYLNTNFIHSGILFEYIYNNNFKAYYFGNYSLERNYNQNKLIEKLNWSYTDKVFDIAIINWQNYMNLLPNGYPRTLKKIVFFKFYKDLKIFNLKRLVYLRSIGVLNRRYLLKYKSNFYNFNYNLKIYYLKLFLFSFIPKNVCNLFIKFFTIFYK